jgi:serine/threonine-protein kinase
VAKLADLGIAVSIDQTRVTRSGIVLGSAAYMAPEQLDGAEIGPAADVYSLATVCFEALAGSKARPGRTPVEIAHSVAVTPPPDVRAHVPGLSEGVADALARGMARDPADRPRTAGRLAAELAEALRRPAPVAPPTAPTRRVAAAPRRPTAPAAARGRPLAGVLAAGLIALAAAAVVAAVLLSGGGSGDDRAGPTDSPAAGSQTKPDKTTSDQQPAQPAPAEPAPTDSTPADSPPADQPEVDPARGIALNEQGFALMGQGDFAGAVPILRRAVASWPQGSTDLEYAYALFNLGKALNRSGQAAAAIPYLEHRLGWPNQRGVVKQELRLARQNAGQG